jgi:hypothetical protein
MPKGLTLSWKMEPPAFHPHKSLQYFDHLLEEKPKHHSQSAFLSIIILIVIERNLKQNTSK